MATVDDVGPRIVDGEPVELSDAEKAAVLAEREAALAAREAQADALAAVRYRRLRARAYRDEMGVEAGDFIITIGDVLDMLLGWAEAEIAAGRAQATPEIEAALAKRAEIKSRYPQ